MDTISYMLGYKKGLASAGSGNADSIHTVTFMSENGTEILYQRSVVDGDNCADVVARGLLAKPTKESTAQYNYTYSGWSLTAGGTASASALSTVTADRTVYAAFTSAVRYYTITFYDGDTVLKTESKAYGSTLSYTPEKDGYSFNGWSPALAMVTGNANYYAQWEERVTFAGGSWADISRISQAGEAANYFKLGDTKNITMTNGSTTESVTLEILGFVDGGGIDIGTVDVLQTVFGKSIQTGYQNTFTQSKFYKIDAATIEGYLPTELRNVLVEHTRQCTNFYNGKQSDVLFKLFLPSVTEVLGIANEDGLYDGEKFAHFTAKKSKQYVTRCYVSTGTAAKVITSSGTAVQNVDTSGGHYSLIFRV